MTNISVAEKMKEELVQVMGVQAEQVDPEMLQLSLDVVEKLMTGKMRLADVLSVPKEKLDIMYTIACNLYKSGKYEKAVNLFDVLCIYDPLKVEYWRSKGETYRKLKDYGQAILAYYTLIRLRPTQMTYYLDLAECLMHLKQLEPAKRCLEAVIGLSEADNLKNRGENNESYVQKAKILLDILEKQTK